MRSISSSELFSVLIDSTGLLSERVEVILFSTVENKSSSEFVFSTIGCEGVFFQFLKLSKLHFLILENFLFHSKSNTNLLQGKPQLL